ncbi:antirestriction protein ArdA [Caulobacter hibisci]|uniref:Antirestriction protein ArdA n=1 Tax=Caulobacter hibisci TaxID=2035993 RepID=A0ABS0T121_9CAUL|nr:antirestriction protein ArdA [Caulobacter hibisci]MBI1685216.1 antirestriction protein ArdA [Caulobacter hibisci]
MGKAGETLEPRIYVACLAAYNSGRLHGVWIEVGDDADAVWEAINAMLKASPIPSAEEHAIHDYEGFGGVGIGEYACIDKVVEIAAFLRERGELGALVLAHVSGDLDEAGRVIEDGYRGVFDSLADYLQDLTEETIQIPEALRHYIDYEAMARDAQINGDVFSLAAPSGRLHVFSGA